MSQLNYPDAHEYLQQAICRAPSVAMVSGFYQIVHKFSIVAGLLMGDISECSLFWQLGRGIECIDTLIRYRSVHMSGTICRLRSRPPK
jgi:hypothetical protein